MKMTRMEVLTKDEVELIHNSTLELLETTGIMVDSPEARILLNKDLKIILLTLGEKGAICLTESEAYYGNVKIENAIDTVGSGDAFLAGFIYKFLRGREIVECFKCAIASGAANTLIPGPGILKKEIVSELLKKVELVNLN